MIWHSVRTALVSIWTKKTRSFLTMLGIIIGVAQIIALIGLGQGVKNDVSAQVTQLGSNILFVVSGKIFSGNGGFNPGAAAGASTLTDQDIDALKKLPDITEATPVSLVAGVPTAGQVSAPGSLIVAVESSFFDFVSTSKLVAGHYFASVDNSEKHKVVVLEKGTRETLFPGLTAKDVIGKSVKLGKEEFTVVGAAEAPPSTSVFGGSDFSNALYIPFQTAKMVNPNTQILRIGLKARDTADVKAVAQTVQAKLTELHGADDTSVITQDDILNVIDNVLSLITKAVVGLATISLIVGGIGIMNIMLVAVTERTREIGIRKAVGATTWHILVQFLTESIIISLIGGAIGVAIPALAGILVKQKAGLTIVIDWNSILIATAFSAGVGIIFGLAPAIRAARKDPIEALRYE